MLSDAANLFETRFAQEADFLCRRGISLADLSAGEVAALVHAVERVCSPYADANAELVERPVAVCKGVWLWPPTAGAQIWLDEYAARWWPKGTMRWKWATVYALKNARDKDAFAPLTTRLRAEAAIVMCALSLPVHGAELQAAIDRAYGSSPHDAPAPRPTRSERLRRQAQTDFASLVARLEVESGITRDAWLWGRSLVYTMTAYAAMHEFAAAFAAGGGRGRSRMMDELDDALRNLARVKEAIVRGVEDRRARAAAGIAQDAQGSPSGVQKATA